MTFKEVLAQVIDWLQQDKRLSYRALKRQFALDDAYLDDLKAELIEVRRIAVEEDGQILVWTGDAGTPPSSPSSSSQAVSPPAPVSPTPPEAERRQLTVLFCDLVDSTKLSGQLDPEEYRDVVRAYQVACTEVIRHYDGHIAQLLGDGLLVYFGYPQAHEDDARRAVRTGLGILHAMGDLNTRLHQDKGIQLALRMGMHTGLVVIGEMGGAGRQEQLALGETPNIAARIQGLAAPNTLMLSASTYRLIQGYFDCEAFSAQTLRGIAEPVAVYRVLSESGVHSRLDIARARGLTPLVGREQEVGILLARWAQVQDRRFAGGPGIVRGAWWITHTRITLHCNTSAWKAWQTNGLGSKGPSLKASGSSHGEHAQGKTDCSRLAGIKMVRYGAEWHRLSLRVLDSATLKRTTISRVHRCVAVTDRVPSHTITPGRYPMHRRSLALLALGALLLFSREARAFATASPEEVGLSTERLARIGQALTQQIEARSFPGAVALVMRKGRIAYFEAFGQLEPQTGAPMAKDAIFRLYSMTKPFTSVAALMLVEDGRLRLMDPVGLYLPQLAKLEVAMPSPEANGKPPYTLVAAERPVTLYDLLRHTSGIVYAGFTRTEYIKDLYTKAKVGWADVTPAEQLDTLATVPLARQPGTMWEYGLSTDVVGRVIEAVTGMPLGRFLDERVFRPLQMPDTTFYVPADKVKRLAQPLATDRATGKPITLHDVTVAPKNDAGGAGAAGTAMDYLRFLHMLAQGGQCDGQRLLARTTVRHMTTDHLGDIKPATPQLAAGYGFGLGFAIRRADGLNGAPGSAGEYSWGGAGGTVFWVDPKEQLVAILMTQAQPGPWQREFRELFRQLVYQAIVD